MDDILIKPFVFLLNGEVPLETADRILRWVIGSLAALGGVLFIYIVFNIINSILNRKKYKQLEVINKKLEDIEYLLEKNLKQK